MLLDKSMYSNTKTKVARLTGRAVEEQVGRLNQILVGWANYFRLGNVTGAWRAVQQQACCRLRWWLRRKRRQKVGVHGYPDMQLYENYGLVNLDRKIRRIAVGVGACVWSESRMREIRTSGSMSGEWKRAWSSP